MDKVFCEGDLGVPRHPGDYLGGPLTPIRQKEFNEFIKGKVLKEGIITS